MDQRNVHTAQETDRSGLIFRRRDHTDQVRAFVLTKDKRGHVALRRLAVGFHNDAVYDREFDIWVIGRHLLHDRTLGKSDADHQIEIPLGKCTHGRFDRGRVAGLYIVETDVHVLLRAFNTFPRRGIERPVILASDVEDYADPYLAAF